MKYLSEQSISNGNVSKDLSTGGTLHIVFPTTQGKLT